MRRLRLHLAAVGLLAVLAAAPPARGAVAENGRIAFTRDGGAVGTSSIWSVNADGTDERRLTTASGFSSSPAWSPDGKRIAFTTNRDGDFEVYVMNADGTEQTRLTRSPGGDNRPTWSPDGRLIAFDSERDSTSSRFFHSIYVMNADGSAPHSVSAGGHDDLAPAWYPNGGRIVFYSNENGPGPRQLFDVAPDDATNRRQISADATLWYQDPSLAPDGTRIAVWSPPPGGGFAEIFTLVPDGSGVVRLTTNNSVDDSPAWSPNGRQIVFDSNRLGNPDLFVMNADGTDQRPVVSSALAEFDPDWGARPAATPVPPAAAAGSDSPAPAPQPQPTSPAATAVRGPVPTLASPVSYVWRVKKSRLTLTQLVVRSLPPGASATLRCTGRRCPLKVKRIKARQGRALDVLKALGRKRVFRAKQMVELVLAAPGYNSKVLRFHLRAARVPKSALYCIPLGGKAVKRRC